MTKTRTLGLNHIYFDEQIEGYSNLAAGYILRALGHGLKVNYIDCANTSSKLSNFLENLSLSYSFTKNFPDLYMDIYTFKPKELVTRTLIPQVEFANYTVNMFWKKFSTFKHDLIIVDNVDFEKISKFKIINLLDSKQTNTEFVFIFNNKKDFVDIKTYFDFNCELTYKKNEKGLSNIKSILNITGTGRGKSFYSYGYLIRSFIQKKDVKLIYFDKEHGLYGEQNFFTALKKWARENEYYGNFDFVSTGAPRFNGATYRKENTDEDIAESKEALMLLKTSLLKQTPVIADELNTAINSNLLTIDEVYEVLEKVKHELIITGAKSPKKIQKISSLILQMKSTKDYLKRNKGFRKGIDF